MKKLTLSLILIVSILFSSCTPPALLCQFDFFDYSKTYEFDYSKEELKDRIVDAYSYNTTGLRQALGRSLVHNADINKGYKSSGALWLDKKNWDKFKSEIREKTTDTLDIKIVKYRCREEYSFRAIIAGDGNKSSLTITNFKYQRRKACRKDSTYYVINLPKRMERKFINKLK